MIEGLAELEAFADALTAEGREHDRRVEKAVGRTVRHLTLLSRATAPVRLGHLRASIQGEHNGLEGEVYSDNVAAIFQEFGTSRHGPQPFLLVHERAAQGRLTEELERESWQP